MNVLVIAEHDNNEIKGSTIHAIAAAYQLGGSVDLLVAGLNCSTAATNGAKIDPFRPLGDNNWWR